MGTNYFWVQPKCAHCGKQDEPIHIGKKSYGWRFHFNAPPELDDPHRPTSWSAWKKCLTGELIENEYGDPITLDLLEQIVHGGVATCARDHIDYCLKESNHKQHMETEIAAGRAWHDPEGFTFTSTWFR